MFQEESDPRNVPKAVKPPAPKLPLVNCQFQRRQSPLVADIPLLSLDYPGIAEIDSPALSLSLFFSFFFMEVVAVIFMLPASTWRKQSTP